MSSGYPEFSAVDGPAYAKRYERRKQSPAWQQDIVYGPLSALAANAHRWTAEEWEQVQREFRHQAILHTEERQASRARRHHDRMYAQRLAA